MVLLSLDVIAPSNIYRLFGFILYDFYGIIESWGALEHLRMEKAL